MPLWSLSPIALSIPLPSSSQPFKSFRTCIDPIRASETIPIYTHQNIICSTKSNMASNPRSDSTALRIESPQEPQNPGNICAECGRNFTGASVGSYLQDLSNARVHKPSAFPTCPTCHTGPDAMPK